MKDDFRKNNAFSGKEHGFEPAYQSNRGSTKIRRLQDPICNKACRMVIQAQKAGILRDIITADRAFTILITGQPNDYTIKVGVGKWVQNLAVAAAEAIVLSVLFLAVDIPEILWTQHVERGIVKEIQTIVDKTSPSEVYAKH